MINSVHFVRDVDAAWRSTFAYASSARDNLRGVATLLSAARTRQRNLAHTERELLAHAATLRDDIGWPQLRA